MSLIRSHKFTGAISVFLVVAMVGAIVPWNARPAVAGGVPTTALLFAVADNSGSNVTGLAEMATNRIQVAMGKIEGLEVTEFHRSSPLVRRAVSEGRLLPIHMEAGVGDVPGAIIVGHTLGVEAIILATVKSVDAQMPPRRISLTLAGEYYLVGASYDEAAGQPIAAPQPEKSFVVTGTSRPRANYTGSDRPLVREALGDAASKFAQVIGGTPVSQLAAEYAQPRKTSKMKWLGPLMIVGLLVVALSNSGGDGDGAVTPADAPRPLRVEVDVNAIRLDWRWDGWQSSVPPYPPTLLCHEIERSMDGGAWGRIDNGVCGKERTSWPDYDVVAGNNYSYRIRAVYTDQSVSAWQLFSTVVFAGG